MRNLHVISLILLAASCCLAKEPPAMRLDPVTRMIHVQYDVPAGAPDEVTIVCTWAPAGQDDWRPARVTPLLTETASSLLPEDTWKQWVTEGKFVERRAAGLERTVVFNPYPEAQVEGKIDVEFRVQVLDPGGNQLALREIRLQADNSDVFYIEDWSQVIQQHLVAENATKEDMKWKLTQRAAPSEGVSLGNCVSALSPQDRGLPPITYPLDLKGWYAIFVMTKAHWGVDLRLSGDDRKDRMGSGKPYEEVFWRWARMDRQHLVIYQTHNYTGWCSSQIDYVKLVPLTDEQAAGLSAPVNGPRDRIVAGYWEPYSWAFSTDLRETLQHREPLAAFAEARVDIVDTQVGRFGMKMVYETREADQLLYSTIGDPIGKISQPTTDNVGRMQQYTNTLDATLRYCRDLGVTAHANFGATNCYPDSPLQGQVTIDHPDWRRGHAMRYELPEVREFILGLYRETLEIGAGGLSIDFCRYPEGIDEPETCNAFLRELAALRTEIGAARGTHIPLLVRFPARGVKLWQNFDYKTWIAEGLVDYLCPSNIQGRHMWFDVGEYLQAAEGSDVMVMPVVDGLSWGLPMPGPFLRRVHALYGAGCKGVYVYQADGRILGEPGDRRVIRMLCDSEAVSQWCAEDATARLSCTKDIYITPYHQEPGYHGWERLRIWVEGVAEGKMEVYLDEKPVSVLEGPPYMLGTEDTASDGVIPSGEHTLRVRVQDGEGWLEREFKIVGA